ncbi:hypothetical protein J437_LFUL014983 [Ladona fulva]|uniref:Transposase n=1 Tax=Ladona fulva TaxID=123851 RepID=A0A8K0KGZ7_LADFU|nr:hypothetical protein J437_LFUL014983 [Ladona fulva]
MLEQFVYPQIQDLQPNIVFQQDGAPPHNSTAVQRQVPGREISQSLDRTRRTHFLATTFHDITPLDFFLWRFVKDRVYATEVDDIPMLRYRITDAIATVIEDMLRRT